MFWCKKKCCSSRVKEPVTYIEELYVRYPGGGHVGDTVLVLKANESGACWAYWNEPARAWFFMGDGGDYLNVYPSLLSYPVSGGSLSLNLSTNKTWNVSSSVGWLTVVGGSGTGDGSVTLIASANAGAERAGTVAIVGGGITRSVAVVQAAGAANYLNVSPTSLAYPVSGGSLSLQLSTNVAWSVSSSVGWLTALESSGTGDGTVTLTASANAGSVRTGTVTISGGGITRSVAVSQAAGSVTPGQVYLSITSSDSQAGEVSPASGYYTEGSSVPLMASPFAHYSFSRWDARPAGGSTWQQVSTSASVNALVTGAYDAYRATFVRSEYQVSVSSADPSMGGASGGGWYPSGGQATITATAAPGNAFQQWSDGNVTNPRVLTNIQSDISLTASFASQATEYYLSFNATSGGSVNMPSGNYAAGTVLTLVATPDSDYEFLLWEHGDPGGGLSTYSTDATVEYTVVGEKWIRAVFAPIDPELYSLTVSTEDATKGLVRIGLSGEFSSSASVMASAFVASKVSAQANDGYVFQSWSDGNVQPERFVIINSDTSLIASFVSSNNYLNVSPEEIELSPEGDSDVIGVSANVGWVAEVEYLGSDLDVDPVSVSLPAEGGEATLSVSSSNAWSAEVED